MSLANQHRTEKIFFFFAFLAFLIIVTGYLKSHVLAPVTVVGDSMEPTLRNGDTVYLDLVTYRLRRPTTGEIAVIKNDGSNPAIQHQLIVKRIIAREGQTVHISGGLLYVNYRPVMEPYATDTSNESFGPLTVPEGAYFVMGDNRDSSGDSRLFGAVNEDKIIGRVVRTSSMWPVTLLATLTSLPTAVFAAPR